MVKLFFSPFLKVWGLRGQKCNTVLCLNKASVLSSAREGEDAGGANNGFFYTHISGLQRVEFARERSPGARRHESPRGAGVTPGAKIIELPTFRQLLNFILEIHSFRYSKIFPRYLLHA